MKNINSIRFVGGNCPEEVFRGIVPIFSYNGEMNDGLVVFPGFCDVHVHLREPGFSYKETLKTGAKAASHGGYTTVCTMPNLKPVPDCYENLKVELDMIKEVEDAEIIPFGAISIGEKGEELAKLEEMSEYVAGFSDDGKGVQRDELMKEAMLKAKALGKVITAHCEDNSLLDGGYIHDGKYAKEHGHKGIVSASEYKQVERDIELVRETGCAYHVCHVSSKESVELIRQAKKEGLDITCETAPHYLVFTDEDLEESGNFKMNPPIRGKEDRDALIEGLLDGTVDIIATDHAPHSEEEKNRGLKDSLNGIVGLETAFPVLYTELVLKGVMSLDMLIDKLVNNPRKRFGISYNGYTIFNLKEKYTIDSKDFLSKGKASPFIGREVYGKHVMTCLGGKK